MKPNNFLFCLFSCCMLALSSFSFAGEKDKKQKFATKLNEKDPSFTSKTYRISEQLLLFYPQRPTNIITDYVTGGKLTPVAYQQDPEHYPQFKKAFPDSRDGRGHCFIIGMARGKPEVRAAWFSDSPQPKPSTSFVAQYDPEVPEEWDLTALGEDLYHNHYNSHKREFRMQRFCPSGKTLSIELMLRLFCKDRNVQAISTSQHTHLDDTTTDIAFYLMEGADHQSFVTMLLASERLNKRGFYVSSDGDHISSSSMEALKAVQHDTTGNTVLFSAKSKKDQDKSKQDQ